MEENKKLKFPIGAIFLLVYVFSQIVNSLQVINPYFSFLNVIKLISLAAIAVLCIMKKRGLCIIIPSSLLLLVALIGLFKHQVNFSVADLLFYAPLIIISLDDMKIGKLSEYRKWFGIALIACVALKVISSSKNTFFMLLKHNTFLYSLQQWISTSLVLSLGVLLTGLWLLNSYKAEKEKESANEDGIENANKDFYISLGKHICLLLFTCGIWQMIWIHKTTKFTNAAKGEEKRNPTNKLLLCLFVPFYMIYWTYKTALRIDKIAKASGAQSDLGTICLILAIFVGFVPPILMQEKINQIILGGNEPQNDDSKCIESLEKYKSLLDSGIITQEEFDAKKKQLLGL